MMKKLSHDYIKRLKQALDAFPHEQFESLIDVFCNALENKRTIFVMGNGGSGATASHWTCDMNKGCGFGRNKRFRMICLNENMPTILAYGNDVGYDNIFIEQLKNYLEKGDVVVAISASGNSRNIIKAVEYAKYKRAITVGLSGFSGGELIRIVDLPIHIKLNDMQMVEDVHLIIAHMIMQYFSKITENSGKKTIQKKVNTRKGIC